jgi:hypothetical protein
MGKTRPQEKDAAIIQDNQKGGQEISNAQEYDGV